jgi:hypothetical protein
MAQADSSNTTTTSAIDRRGALSRLGCTIGLGSAAGILVSVPAVACGSDAELAEIGRKLQSVLIEYLPLIADSCERGIRAHNEAWAAVDNKMPETLQCRAFMKELGRTEEATGFTAANSKAEAMEKVIEPLVKRALALPGYTMGGLRTHVMCSIYANTHLWRAALDDLDWGDMVNRRQIETACQLTGVAVPEVRIIPVETRRGASQAETPSEPLPEPSQLQLAYSEWLAMERRLLTAEMYGDQARHMERFVPSGTMAHNFHFPTEEGRSWEDVPKPSSRADLVLQAVGVRLDA